MTVEQCAVKAITTNGQMNTIAVMKPTSRVMIAYLSLVRTLVICAVASDHSLKRTIEVSIVRNRLQFIGINEDGTRDHTQASGSVSAATVSDFVESFWYWKKQH